MPGRTKGGLIILKKKKNKDLGTAGNWVPAIICGSGCCAWDHAVTRVAPAEDRPQCLTFFIRSLGFIESQFQKQTFMTFRERKEFGAVCPIASKHGAQRSHSGFSTWGESLSSLKVTLAQDSKAIIHLNVYDGKPETPSPRKS